MKSFEKSRFFRNIQSQAQTPTPGKFQGHKKKNNELDVPNNDILEVEKALNSLKQDFDKHNGNSEDFSRKLKKIKQQHENDNKLYEQLIDEQKEKIRQLETEIMHLHEKNQGLENDKKNLQLENNKLRDSLHIESEKVSASESKYNGLKKEISKVIKEKNELKEKHKRTDLSLAELIKLLKALLSLFVKSLNTMCTKYYYKNKQDKELFSSMKHILASKLNALFIAIPSLGLLSEIQTVNLYVTDRFKAGRQKRSR